MTGILLGSQPATASPTGDSRSHAARRVVLIDPRPERRAITRLLIDRCAALTVVGLASSLDEARSLVDAEQADIVLVEIQMPVPEGLATIAGLRDQFPDLRIVVCSFHDNAPVRDAARAHGADGYLGKPLQIEDLLRLVTPTTRAPGDADI